MSFSRIYSAQTYLLSGKIITIEVDISRGLHSFAIVGLPDKAVDESKDRVCSAIKNSGFESPKSKNQKIIVSLSPAEIRKEGPYFDLGIALAYLQSEGEIIFDASKKLFLGELSLNGELKPIRGALPLVEEAKKKGFEEIYIPKQNAKEAALISGISIFGANSLKEVIEHINEKSGANPIGNSIVPEEFISSGTEEKIINVDFSDIKGQESAKRALEIAAAGGHNIALYGPPGTGKTMLAKAFSALLPQMSHEEVLEVTGIYSIAGLLQDTVMHTLPFRAPHHTASYVSMIGGGSFPKPGEVTLAHRGVLFLDEFPEFEKKVLESLRQPLEDNVVSISRARGTALFPSNFILIAAMNPCPCGNKGNKLKECICKPFDIARYTRKLSGPIMDRIDVWVEVGPVEYKKLHSIEGDGEKTTVIQKRIQEARDIQTKRFQNIERTILKNSDMSSKEVEALSNITESARNILNRSAETLALSPRAYYRTIKLARTIADLEGSEEITDNHILEGLQYRPKMN